MFLEPNEIISFSASNKTINENLKASNNPAINNIFHSHVTKRCFETEDDDIELALFNKKNRNDILENSWKSNINWNLYLNYFFKHFKLYQDNQISKMVLDSFKYHMYLPDLRKENNNLEFPYSTLHQTHCYDTKFKEICTYNYYGNFINNYYIKNHGNGCNIKILKQGYPFENELKNFINTYDEIISNNDYKEVINNIINYDFEKLEEIYENVKKNRNKINNIIYFILWANKSFIWYCMYILENINRFEDDKDEKKFLNEIICKYNNYINSILLINHNFENVNIIINYLNYFIVNNNASEKFSLYELARKIYKKTVYDKISEQINNKTSLFYKKVLNNIINNQNQIEDEDKDKDEDNEMNDTNDTSDCEMSLDDICEQYKEKNEKEILENIINNILDIAIDKNNGKVINHYKINLGKEYENLENSLIQTTLETIQEYIIKGEKTSLELFGIIEKLFKFEENIINFKLNTNSFKLINRTKKRILDQSLIFIYKYNFPIISKDFNSRLKTNNNGRKLYITKNEILNKKEYKYDLSDFDDKKKMQIEGKIEEEIKNLKLCLYGENINGYKVEDTKRLVNEYMDNNGIEIVLLMKKMIFCYLKEFELYEEKAQRIHNLLNKKDNDYANSFLRHLIKL